VTAGAFTVKKLAFNANDARGVFAIGYRVFLSDFPQVSIQTESAAFVVVLKDPCIDKAPKKRSSLCLTKAYVKGGTPEWITRLSDKLIGFGLNYTYFMEPATDDFGRPVTVEVVLRAAEAFVRYNSTANALVVLGDAMWDRSTTHYHLTVATEYIDVFGIQQYFKREIHFVVVQNFFSRVKLTDRLVFAGEDQFVLLQD